MILELEEYDKIASEALGKRIEAGIGKEMVDGFPYDYVYSQRGNAYIGINIDVSKGELNVEATTLVNVSAAQKAFEEIMKNYP